MRRSGFIKTSIATLLVSTSALFGYRLMTSSQDYHNEVSSILLFSVNISSISVESVDEVSITLNFTNPSLKDVMITSVINDVYHEGELVGQRYIDLSTKPLRLKAQSTLDYEVPVRVSKVQLHKGMEIHVKARITLETIIFGLVHRETEKGYLVGH